LLGQGIVLQPALAKKADAPKKLSVSFYTWINSGLDQTLTTVSWSNPKALFVFGIATDFSIRVRSMGSTLAWGSWTNLGTDPVTGRYFTGIKAVAWQGHVSLFALDSVHDVWHKGFAPYGGWGAWENLGGSAYSDFRDNMQVVSWTPGRIDVFVNYNWDVSYHKWFADNTWSPSGGAWEKLNFRAGSAVSWGVNRIDLLGYNSAGNYFHHYTNNNGWWPSGMGDNMNYPSYEDPLLLSTGSNRLDIFAPPSASPVYQSTMYKAWTGSNWTGWTDIGEAVRGQCSSIGGVSWGTGRFDLFEVCSGTSGGVYHKGHDANYWYPNLTGWEFLGGGTSLAKAEVTSWGPNRLDIFAIQKTDGSLWHLAWGDSGWWPGVNSWELVNP
jgi:hypothetical protein